MLKILDYPNPHTNITEKMFFLGKYEIPEPVSIPSTRLKDGRIVIAISDRGKRKFSLTRQDLGDFVPKKTLDTIPEWLDSK